MRILIVEDDKDLALAIQHILMRDGHDVDISSNGEEGIAFAESELYDIAIFDAMLPKVDGFEAIRRLRKKGLNTPILMLTALGAIPDKIEGLDSGADSYMTKPFSPKELLARIRALTRRKIPEYNAPITSGDLILDKTTRNLSCKNESIQLSNKEYLLAELLISNADITLTRAQIANAVWDENTHVEDNSIEAYVSMLRKKLRFLESETQIKSERSIGYRLLSSGKTQSFESKPPK